MLEKYYRLNKDLSFFGDYLRHLNNIYYIKRHLHGENKIRTKINVNITQRCK